MSSVIHELFGEALDQPEAVREAWLRSRCGDDFELFNAVSALLRADAGAGVLDGNIAELAEPLITQHNERDQPAQLQQVGKAFGPYHVLELLGHGGMGSVWLAERRDGGFQQRVAIKLLASALPSPEALQRFTRERQILARLQHPNIARVLDGGSVDGAPWFAMDLVDGEALDVYVKRAGLSLEQTLRVFSRVVAAVQFAHQNLIVHRDLKPSNILVEANGEPKLLDFGVAKLLDEGSDLSVSRAPLSMAYAAPEQIAGTTITTATDIYSLGVILYELLAGSRPHKARGNSSLALMQAITDTDPEPPSRAAATHTTRNARRLKGDLDTIVLKCLSREPSRRYASAQALGDDLEAFLGQLPIRARPESFSYRSAKFLRRHWLGAAMTALATLALIATTAFSVTQAGRANEAARVASAERDASLAEARHQEALSEHFGAVINRAVASGEQVAVKQLLDWASDPRLLGDFGDPRMQRTISLAVANLLVQNNDFPNALKLLDELQPQLADAGRRDRLQALDDRTLALIRTGQLDAAETSLIEAQALLPPGDRGLKAATLHNYRAQLLRARGEIVQATQLTRESGEWAAAATDGSPLARGEVVGSAANGLLQLGDLEGAIANAETAARIWREARVSQNASSASVLAVAPSARFLRGDIALALEQLDQLALGSGAAESIPPRAARDGTRAKAMALLNRRDEALSLAEAAAGAMCSSVGADSMDCLRMRVIESETARLAGDFETSARLLDGIDAHLRKQPLPVLQVAVDRYRLLLSILDDPQPARLDELFALVATPAQSGLPQRNAMRSLLVLAEQLHVLGHTAAAARCAETAIAVSAGLKDRGGMDHSLAELWQARLQSAPAPQAALDALSQALGADHPWVRAHRNG